MGKRFFSWVIATLLIASGTYGQVTESTDSVWRSEQLQEVSVSVHGHRHIKMSGLGNTDYIGSGELLRAACCNLGESFTTNPSVDVNYADAATGAQQIKLLGLSGTYVQMLTENIPNYRGAAAPYSLGYIPGPWMQSIQVSKGASSVKNGYESITGQINVEFKKPQLTPFVDANLFYNTKNKVEANLGANLELSNRWSMAFLGHYEILDKAHDENDDGFADMPKVRQGSLMNRWAYMGDNYIFQAAIKGLKEHRESGQISSHHSSLTTHPYTIDITNERYEAFAKNAFIFDPEHGSNIALILSGSLHHENALYGHQQYNTDQRNGYASLMFETDFNERHSLSTGVSLNHDKFDFDETTPGVYAQYTYKIGEKFTLMGGLRWDNSNIYGSFITPRMHLKYSSFGDVLTLRGSIGKGYRTNHVMAEYNYMLASSRQMIIDSDLDQEEAWNYGLSVALNIPIGDKRLELNAEYYYTSFLHQLLIDMDSDPHAIHFTNLKGDSYSNTWQVEVTYPLFEDFSLTATYRRTNVKATYGGVLREKPLTNKYKGLITAQYKPGLGKWQFDVTLQLNGGGRLPDAHTTANGQPSWDNHYNGYEQLNAQVTRFFRNWSIYAGGENITARQQKNPIIDASNPWGPNFDATMVWGPMHGAIYYFGIRLNWIKI